MTFTCKFYRVCLKSTQNVPLHLSKNKKNIFQILPKTASVLKHKTFGLKDLGSHLCYHKSVLKATGIRLNWFSKATGLFVTKLAAAFRNLLIRLVVAFGNSFMMARAVLGEICKS
jgi:hypothetical protein